MEEMTETGRKRIVKPQAVPSQGPPSAPLSALLPEEYEITPPGSVEEQMESASCPLGGRVDRHMVREQRMVYDQSVGALVPATEADGGVMLSYDQALDLDGYALTEEERQIALPTAATKWKNRRSEMKDMLSALKSSAEAEIKMVEALDADSQAEIARNKVLGKEERLRIAADIGDFATVRELIDEGADIDSSHSKNGQTALMYAAVKGHISIATLLIEARCNVLAKDNRREAAVIHAFKADKPKLVSLLLQHRANPDSKDEGGRPLLMVAAAEGKRGMLMLAMAANAKTELRLEQHTALHLAIRNHHQSCVLQLLEMGASPQTAGPKHMSPLIIACAIGNLEAVRVLLAYHANPLWVDQDGFRALDHARENSSLKDAFAEFGYSGPTQWKCRVWCMGCFSCCRPGKRYRMKSDNTQEYRDAASLRETLEAQAEAERLQSAALEVELGVGMDPGIQTPQDKYGTEATATPGEMHRLTPQKSAPQAGGKRAANPNYRGKR